MKVRMLSATPRSTCVSQYSYPHIAHQVSISIDVDEKSFLIGVELRLRTYTFEGRNAISWRDVQATDPNDRFEFVADAGTSKATRDLIERTVLQAVYERKYLKTSSGVSDKELRALAYEYVAVPVF
jgi:hypothetical protein